MSPEHVFDIVAIICFAIAAIPWPPQPPIEPVRMLGLGSVFFTLAHLVAGGTPH